MSGLEGGSRPQAMAARPLPDAAIDEQTAALAAPADALSGPQVSLLLFRAAGERFALPATSIERVIPIVPVRRVPHRNRPAFRGLLAHEGEIVPTGSLERLLDLGASEPGEASNPRFVVLGPAGRAWAFQVDAVDGVFSVPQEAMRPAATTVARAMGSASRLLACVNGAEVAVLDPSVLRTGWEAAAA